MFGVMGCIGMSGDNISINYFIDMKKRTVYIIQGYEEMTPDGRMTDVSYFEIYTDSEKKAIEKAKTYSTLPKKYYRLERVIETYK